MGQGRLRRHGHHQSRPAGAGHDGRRSKTPSRSFTTTIKKKSISLTCPPMIRSCIAPCKRPIPSACFRSKAVRRCLACRAFIPHASTTLWCKSRSSARGPSSERWSIRYLMRTTGTRAGRVSASLARTRAGADARRAAVSGATLAHGHDRCRIHRRTKRKSCVARWASNAVRNACATSK